MSKLICCLMNKINTICCLFKTTHKTESNAKHIRLSVDETLRGLVFNGTTIKTPDIRY